MFGKIRIRIDRADTMFSKYIRLKVGKCENSIFHIGRTLNAHHFITRRKENTRFDEENMICLCIGCHRKFHDNPNTQVEFMLKKLGQERYDALILRSNLYKKKDRAMELIKATALYNDYIK